MIVSQLEKKSIKISEIVFLFGIFLVGGDSSGGAAQRNHEKAICVKINWKLYFHKTISLSLSILQTGVKLLKK